MTTTTSPPEQAAPAWSPARRVAFRFTCAYLVLFNLPAPLYVLPGLDALTEPYDRLWHALVPWVGQRVLGLRSPIRVWADTGSGDKRYDWVRLVVVVALSVVVTVAWSLLDRRRRRHPVAHEALRVYVRYAMAAMMVLYGFAKVFHLQFFAPEPERLLSSFGDASPMGMLWTFMGLSPAYNVFTGGLEVLGGVLLFSRRTTTLGALVVVGVMSNVMMLNFCYDVPVKIFSAHLVLMALFLLAPALRRLADFFVLGRATAPVPPRAPLPARWMERTRPVLKALFLADVLVGNVWTSVSALSGMPRPPPLYGAYVVEAPPGPPTAASPWRGLAVNRFGRLSMVPMSGPSRTFGMVDDAEKKTLALQGRDGASTVLTYAQPDADYLTVEGTLDYEPLSLRLRRLDDARFLLVSRGFHWVNEFPLNR